MSLNTLYQPELQTSAINQNLSFCYPRLLSISASLISTCSRSAKNNLRRYKLDEISGDTSHHRNTQGPDTQIVQYISHRGSQEGP